MSANFEIIVISQEPLTCNQLVQVFSFAGKTELEKEVLVFDDWSFDVENMKYVQNDQNIQHILLDRKIVRYSGLVGNHRIGLIQSYDNLIYTSELWIDTKHIPDLDASYGFSQLNKYICHSISEAILSINQTNPITFFAMGTEMLIEYTADIKEVIAKSHNVVVYGTRINGILTVQDLH